jgi:hypothetical protein
MNQILELVTMTCIVNMLMCMKLASCVHVHMPGLKQEDFGYEVQQE